MQNEVLTESKNRITFHGIKVKLVNHKRIKCMHYYFTFGDNHSISGFAFISLDKKWLKPVWPRTNEWVEVSFNEATQQYEIPDPSGGTPYIICHEVIDMVDSLAVENILLK